MFMYAVITAIEGRKTTVGDVPGAFLSADLEGEDVLMTLRGTLAELMALSAPEIYWDYVVMENGKKILYVRLKKALYGLL